MNIKEPRIYYAKELKKRSYITFYIGDKRIREYNGKALGIDISPNSAKSIAERNYYLEILQKKYHEALLTGHYQKANTAPKSAEEPSNVESIEYVLLKALENKKNLNLSSKYIDTLSMLTSGFLRFLKHKEVTGHIANLTSKRVHEFLLKFNKTPSYYMNRRRHLKALLCEAGKIVDLSLPCLKNLPIQKTKPAAHLPYTELQVKEVLRYLKMHDPALYLCANITYYCWLRPHNEVRFLKARHFREEYSKIVLDANENKSGKVRSVQVPGHVVAIVKAIANDVSLEDNIFSRTIEPFNLSYFSKKWQRCAKELKRRGIIQNGHTLYSFRHTAAIELYRKTGDVGLLQRIMGHAEITTTMTYLRGVGELSIDDWKQATPTLNIL